MNQEQKKRVTLSQIAQAAGVATSTVSTILNNKTRQIPIPQHTRDRVLAAAKQLGYKPNAAARTLATGRSQSILVVALETPYWSQQLAGFLLGVESRLVSSGYSLNICIVGENDDISAYVDIIGSGRADGVLLTGTGSSAKDELLKKIRATADEENVPIIGMANVFPEESALRPVGVDGKLGAKLATEHLLQHGHRRILLLGLANERWASERVEGYRTALEEAGVKVDPELMILLEGHNDQQAYEIALEIANKLDFTAMFAMTDFLAVAAMLGLKTAGRNIPEDCAVVGFDDNDRILQFMDPPLTTVYNPLYEVGQAATEALLDLIEGRPVTPKMLPATLTIRESCGCPSARLKRA